MVTTGITLAIWKDAFQLNTWWVGIISTVLTLAVAMGSLLGGFLSDKFGKIRVFNIDILLVALGTAMVAFAGNVRILLIGLIISGLASGADLPTSLAVISERTSKKVQGKVIASTQVFWVGGIILSQGLGFFSANFGLLGSRLLFSWLFVVSLVTWLVRIGSKSFKKIEQETLLSKSQSEITREQDRSLSLREILKMPRYIIPMMLLTGFYLFWNLPANTWGSFLNYFIVSVNNKSQQFSTAVGFVANIIGVIVLFIIYMRYADTKARYWMLRVGMVLCIASLGLATLYGGYWLVFTIAYCVYCPASLLNGEPLYKIWSQTLYPVNVRASTTGFICSRACTDCCIFVCYPHSYGNISKVTFALFSSINGVFVDVFRVSHSLYKEK